MKCGILYVFEMMSSLFELLIQDPSRPEFSFDLIASLDMGQVTGDWELLTMGLDEERRFRETFRFLKVIPGCNRSFDGTGSPI